MQYESQNLPFVKYEIGWYCRYTADNERNYFYPIQIIPDDINKIFAIKNHFVVVCVVLEKHIIYVDGFGKQCNLY